eukprot:Ihof_evm1s825 gene=Ihof_evmTU1s825
MKYIVVSGGVISGIGKGVIASSVGFMLKSCGLRVTSIKIDPYLNIDAGTFSPYEHGEVFVLDDGGEVDLDLGNYERFIDITLHNDNNITTGKIYRNVIERERKGDYLGQTVQVVPHVTNEIQDWIEKVAKKSVDVNDDSEPEVCVIELGGTVGDIESAPFVEAMRQFQFRVGADNFLLVHVSLVPVVGTTGEQKTKPTQHSVRELRGLGLSPDVVVCRSTKVLNDGIKSKISMFCHVAPSHVINVHDCTSVWKVPLLLIDQGFLKIVASRLNLAKAAQVDLSTNSMLQQWSRMTTQWEDIRDRVKIVIVGKYTGMSDAYLSLIKALQHAGLMCDHKIEMEWIEAEHLEKETLEHNPAKYHDAWGRLCTAKGILVPGGFGARGVLGKIEAAKWARENKIPYLGICLGLQVAVIEFARNILKMADANSEEFDPETPNKAVVFMPEGSKEYMGGTMRLGQRKTIFTSRGCLMDKMYGEKEFILERHRHRYEVNPEMVPELEKNGMRFVGRDETGKRMEIMELDNHPFYVAVQYHPELLSRPLRPSPVFLGFVLA